MSHGVWLAPLPAPPEGQRVRTFSLGASMSLCNQQTRAEFMRESRVEGSGVCLTRKRMTASRLDGSERNASMQATGTETRNFKTVPELTRG